MGEKRDFLVVKSYIPRSFILTGSDTRCKEETLN